MNVLKNGELWLYGTVGEGVTDEEGFTPINVRDALAEIGSKDVTVRVNSGGGWAADGVAIYNILRSHPGKVTVLIEGIAASAASVLAMAGQEIIMRPGAFMMVHEASGLTWGNAQDHAKTIESLEIINRSLADIYVKQTRRPSAEIRREMADETWMDGGQAVQKRYATRITDGRAAKPAAFAWDTYAKVPAAIAAAAGTRPPSRGFQDARERIVAAASAKAERDVRIAAFIRENCLGRESDPDVKRVLTRIQEEAPEAYAKAKATGPLSSTNVVNGPSSWDHVVDRLNKANNWFSVHPSAGEK
ncbi:MULTISPECIES: head maturation protease, ClpP-related [unclassified Rhizobium]|uniref:head maturation protease, ClpP-related n=1 Tax=unclassified Rhizobium TaxID=2613769 RepID=UPI0007EA2786|nr:MULTISPECIES: head maturation protease, ClpP-related [unclassified Rhizobium]ANK84454.1 peptidase S14 family protein [Rhizobium sp. N731]ANL14702.1 peptidase S14 family protein [Rhizobium sp. N1314]